MNQYAERVARGVLWLDHMHDGWRDDVEIDSLNLFSGEYCILAQVANSSYWSAVSNMIGSTHQAAEMGFNPFGSELDEVNQPYWDGEITDEQRDAQIAWLYAHLENEWRTVLSR